MSSSHKGRKSSKTGELISNICGAFKYQSNPNSCYTTCIYNILHEVGIRFSNNDVRIPEARVNKLCGFRDFRGPVLDIVVPNLNKVLRPLGYEAHENRRQRFDDLSKRVRDNDASYPMIGLAYSYLISELKLRAPSQINEPPDHVVVVLECNPEETLMFDPYQGMIRRAPKSDEEARGIVVLSTPRLLEYWNSSQDPSWMFWVERKNRTDTELFSYESKGEGKS